MSANWSLPGTGNLYTDTLTALKDRDADLAVGFDPAYTTPTNIPTNTVRWTSAANRWEKWNGTAWSVLSSGYAINITGTAANITGVAAAANGGTGQSSYTIGDLLYASGATTLSKIADIATGNVLLSGGVGAAPSYGKVGLTTHVSGTLPVANGGTGVATLSGVAFGNGTGAFTAATAAQLVAAIGATKVQAATSADNGGVTSVNGQTGAVTVSVDLSSRVAKTGDTMTGNLTISNANPYLALGDTTSGNVMLTSYDSDIIGWYKSGVGYKMYVTDGGNIWTSAFGFLTDYFSATGHTHDYSATYLPLAGVDAANSKGALVIAYAADATSPAVGTSYSASTTYINSKWNVGFTVSGTWKCVGKVYMNNDGIAGGLFRKTV